MICEEQVHVWGRDDGTQSRREGYQKTWHGGRVHPGIQILSRLLGALAMELGLNAESMVGMHARTVDSNAIEHTNPLPDEIKLKNCDSGSRHLVLFLPKRCSEVCRPMRIGRHTLVCLGASGVANSPVAALQSAAQSFFLLLRLLVFGVRFDGHLKMEAKAGKTAAALMTTMHHLRMRSRP